MNYFDEKSERYYATAENKAYSFVVSHENRVFRIRMVAPRKPTDKDLDCVAKEISFDTYTMMVDGAKKQGYMQVFGNTRETNKGYESSKSEVKRGMAMQTSYDELKVLCDRTLQPDFYYDYEVLKSGISKFVNGEVDGEYFSLWLALCGKMINTKPRKRTNCDYDSDENTLEYFREYLRELSLSHKADVARKDAVSGKLTAILRYVNAVVEGTAMRKNEPPRVYLYEYATHGNVLRYMTLVVDDKNRVYNYFFADDPIFAEEVYYDFMWQDAFFSKAYDEEDFKTDTSFSSYLLECFNDELDECNREYKLDSAFGFDFVK